MSWYNVPDDWDLHWHMCSNCGNKYHASDGGCGCFEQEIEDLQEETISRLQNCLINKIERDAAFMSCDDDFGGDLCKGEPEVRLYITEPDGVDELVFSEVSWKQVCKILGRENIYD